MSNFSDRLRVRKSFDFLTGDQRRDIHEAALKVMERTGIRIHSDRARKDLKAS